MKKKNIITTLVLGFAFLPLWVSAETGSSTVSGQPATEAQVFTACSQASIEVRDNSIGSARTIYNTAMAAALSARKGAEKSAIALTDPTAKKDAIRVAVEEYKKAVTSAQEGLTKARKEAWAAFEANTNNCRDASKETRKSAVIENKTQEPTTQVNAENVKSETKSFRETMLEQFESIKNFFSNKRAPTTENNDK